jgi:hypothetical protein
MATTKVWRTHRMTTRPEISRKALVITHSGRQIDFDNFKTTDVDIHDIAHSLSLTCRYNGHCKKFYSVAEHCVRCSWMCTLERYKKILLLHDAAEAYIGDVINPLKYYDELNGVLNKLDDKISYYVYAKYGIGINPDDKEIIHNVGKSLLYAEMRDIFPYGFMNPCMPLGTVPANIKIRPWSPRKARRLYLREAKRLGIE